MKTLVVAEKTKVANEILKLPRFRNAVRSQGSKPYFGYYENENYIVVWCRGHLLEVMHPEEHDAKYKEFKFEDLPIILPIKYRPIPENQEQLDIVVNLMRRADVEHIINAGDADREGELIFREIYEYANIDKRVSRIFKSSHEAEELEVAFNSLLPGSHYDSLADAAKARQYLDFLLGINITRASTSKLANNQLLLSSGRIQMCLLAEIRKRELEIENFTDKTFFTLSISTDNKIEALYKTEDEFLNQEPLNRIGQTLKGNEVLVSSFEEKESKSNPKDLYNLTDIYKEAIKKYKANSAIVMQHIQHLYDSGYITYPRSDSRHLPTSRLDKIQDAFNQLKNTAKYNEFAEMIEPGVISEKHSAFNDKKVTAHYAITPTSKIYVGDGRPDLEQKLYDMIVKRFLGRFMQPAIYQVRRITLTDNEGREFVASEKILKSPGFLKVFKEDVEKDIKEIFTLPTVSEGQNVIVQDFVIRPVKVRKPSLHNEASLLTFMEKAGNYIEDEDTSKLLKGKRIGTTSTEHTFLPKLLDRKFVEKNEKEFITTTEIGKLFIDSFPIDELKNPDFTAELEGNIESIKDEEMTLDSLKEKTNQLTIKIVQTMSQLPENTANKILDSYKKQIEICSCSCKVGKLLDRGKFYGCSNYPKCDVSFPTKIKGKIIPKNQVKNLFEKGKTDLIKGFKSEDKSFDAFIILEGKEFKFRFPTVEDKSLGHCPACKNGHITLVNIKDKKPFYSCSNFKEEIKCTFQLPHTLLGVTLPVGQIKKYLKNGYTDFINGFVKNDKEFTAALVRGKENELTFKFPTKEDRTLGKCPHCKSAVLIGKQYYLCEKYRKGCDFILPGEFAEKSISSSQIKKILENNLTDLIKGFKKKDGSGTYDAKLSYSIEERKLKLIFPKK